MINKIKSSLSEKILLIFLISLAIFTFGSFYMIKNKDLYKQMPANETGIYPPYQLANLLKKTLQYSQHPWRGYKINETENYYAYINKLRYRIDMKKKIMIYW